MTRMHIDFSPQTLSQMIHRGGWRFITAVTVLVMILAGVASAIVLLHIKTQSLEGQLADLHEQANRMEKSKRKEAIRPPVANQQAMLVMMSQLNLPWAQLLRTFDTISSKQVALLEFSPDTNSRIIKIVAETRNSSQMTRYLESLKKQENLVNVRLIHHEINTADKLNPIRFEFEVQWVTGGEAS
jgi:nitrate reductase NapAB chaperone NapD